MSSKNLGNADFAHGLATAPEVGVLLGFFYGTTMLGLAVLLVLYVRRMNTFPLKGRRTPLILVSSVATALWVCGLAVLPMLSIYLYNGQLPCDLHRALAILTNQTVFLIGVGLIAVRCGTLFFAFELYAMKLRAENDVAFLTDPRTKWFLAHRHWRTNPMLLRVIAGVVTVHFSFYFVQLFAIGSLQCDPNLPRSLTNPDGKAWQQSGVSLITACFALLYGILAVGFAYKYRKFDFDKLSIRTEMRALGYVVSAGAVVWGVITQTPALAQFHREQFPIGRVVIMLTGMALSGIQLGYPVYLSYAYERQKDQSAASGASSESSTTATIVADMDALGPLEAAPAPKKRGTTRRGSLRRSSDSESYSLSVSESATSMALAVAMDPSRPAAAAAAAALAPAADERKESKEVGRTGDEATRDLELGSRQKGAAESPAAVELVTSADSRQPPLAADPASAALVSPNTSPEPPQQQQQQTVLLGSSSVSTLILNCTPEALADPVAAQASSTGSVSSARSSSAAEAASSLAKAEERARQQRKRVRRVRKQIKALPRILAFADVFTSYSRYLGLEFAVDDLLMWNAIRDFQLAARSDGDEALLRRARALATKYFADDSLYDVEVDKKLKRGVLDALRDVEAESVVSTAGSDQLRHDLVRVFEHVQLLCVATMCGPFLRYSRTPDFDRLRAKSLTLAKLSVPFAPSVRRSSGPAATAPPKVQALTGARLDARATASMLLRRSSGV